MASRSVLLVPESVCFVNPRELHRAAQVGNRTWTDLSLRTKGVLVLSVPLLALIVNSVTMSVLLLRQQDAQVWVTHTLDVRVSLQNIVLDLTQVNLALRLDARGKENGGIALAQRSSADLDAAIKRFKWLTADNPRQQERARRLFSWAEQEHFLHIQAGNLSNLQLKLESFQPFLDLVKRMDAEEVSLEQGRVQRLKDIHQALRLLTPATWMFGICGGFAGMILFLNGVANRITILSGQIRKLASGDPVNDPDGSADQIGQAFAGLEVTSQLLARKQLEIEHEIEERKRMQQDLLSQRAELELTLETANDAFIATDENGHITNWNRAAETLFEQSKSQVFGRDLTEVLIPERFRLAHREGMRRYTRTRSSQVLGTPLELAALHPTRGEIPIEITIWSITGSDNKLRYQSFLRDISGRRAVEVRRAKRAAMAELLQQITTAANRAASVEEVAKTSLHHICVTAGFQLAHLYLTTTEDRLVNTDVWFDSDPVRFAGFRHFCESTPLGCNEGIPGRVLQAHAPIWLEEVLPGPDLVRYAVAEAAGIQTVFAFPLWAGDKILGVLEYFSTDRKGQDASLMELAPQIGSELGHVILRKRMEESLAHARDNADQANTAKSTFLATMSHEIRTPMNAILGMADLLSETELNEQQARYVDVFRRASSNLLTLINDILDLSKIESGKFELESIPFDVREIITRTLELIRPKATAKGVELIHHVGSEVPANVTGDPIRLQQVLLNLLGNANKFTNSGSIVLTVTCPGCLHPEHLQFEVVDSGIGIPREKLSFIFQDFAQVNASITRQYGGTGLGLGIAKRLVERMGGRIEVESQPGQGSTFRFTACFDPADSRTVALSDKTTVEGWHLRGHRVLVVDDDDTNRLILRESLQVLGLEISDFASALDAVGWFADQTQAGHRFSLLILDSRMAECDGFQAFTRLRLIDETVPAVMLTSDDRPGEARRSRELGIRDYLLKPVQRPELLRIVSNAILRPYFCGASESSFSAMSPAVPVTGLRILIADDSEDNRFLLEQYFRGTPHHITFAENGEEAVLLYEQESFDLILMDVQMPVLDGRAATRRIRKYEAERHRDRIPILALTANALASDQQASLDAGCDDHLTKPITKRCLLKAVGSYPPRPERREPVTEVKVPEGLEGIVPMYLGKRREDAAALSTLLAASDLTNIQRIGHDMKGTGTSYGFDTVTQLGSELEQAAKTSDLVRLGSIVTELTTYLDRVRLVE